LTPRALCARVLEYLRARHVMTLSTQGDAGPWAAAVFFVNDGFTFYWLSAPSSRHSMELRRNPRVAAAVHEDYAAWPEIKGVQIEGHAGEAAAAEETRARSLYREKYPLVGATSRAPAPIVVALAKARCYKLVAERVHFLDNTIAFGHREELDLRPGTPAPR
jgi:uncharacterized protein